jgi:hypothetical protein
LRQQLGAAEGYRHWPPRRHRQRTLVNAILSLSMLRSGGALLPGRELPRDLLCWQTVSHSLRNSHVAPGWHLGADPNGPAAALSPAGATRPRRGSRVPPAARANRSRPPAWAACAGRTDDGAKQLVGRRRHVLVDTEASSSRSLSIWPTALGEMDRDGIKRVLDDWILAQLPRMQLLGLDADFNGRGKGERTGTGSSAPSAGGSRPSKPCTATSASGCLRA